MKQDIYSQVTDRIIAQLEQGVVPWKSPYFSRVGFPRNFSSGKAYQGINVFLLGSLRFTSPFFLTFLQAKELCGHVRKGEHGSLVVKYGTYNRVGDESPAVGSEEPAEMRRYLKAYTVFNASQIEGIDFPKPQNLPDLAVTDKTEHARAIVAGMPSAPAIREGSAIPCYRPASDSVHMPERGYFETEESYYSTLFHELTHSTGHASRLARPSLLENKGIDADGDTARKVYAEEELVAEMGASFLNAHAGIEEQELGNSAAYLQGWIDALKSRDAKGWIIRAAAQAQKAANYILDIRSEEPAP
jgi:antirestriction protein ArdC